MFGGDATIVLKVLHLVGAAVLLGSGAAIAFFMWMANRTGDVAVIAGVARRVVLADGVFTASAGVAQPVTGILLALAAGHDLASGWILASVALYLLAGACWLPVVRIQMRLRDMAVRAKETGAGLPAEYTRLARIWFALGWPAFVAVLAIFALMVARPPL